jgi:hypothetical protein
VIAGRHAEAGMAVDDARVPADDRDVGEQPGGESRAHRGSVHRGNDGFRAVDHVEHEVPRFAHDTSACGFVVQQRFDQLEAAAGGEGSPCALEDRDVRLRITIDRDPHVRQLAMHRIVDRIQTRARERDAKNARGGSIELQVREGRIRVGQRSSRIRRGENT